LPFAGLGHRDQYHRAGRIGLPAEHPALQKAAAWLSNKEVRIRGDWTKNNPHPEASGWAFEYNNVYYPDTDDTAMVLMALRLVRPEDQNSATKICSNARSAWQLSFPMSRWRLGCVRQGRDQHWLENMPFADHNAILDPTCSDLTARTLELFGYINFDREDACGATRFAI
jgi:squalene-hopene/tetraprenyl-beta-curcumene cyclase